MKSIFASRTFWASALSFVTGAAMLSHNPAVVTIATIANDPAMQAQILLMGGGVAHAVLRLATTAPVRVLPK